jgi:hypothetical protein
MAKLLKILGKSILTLIEFIILILIVLAFSIRTTTFQTYLAKQGSSYLSNKIGADVQINEVSIVFFDRIYLEKLYVEDHHGDTLAYLDELFVNINDFNLSTLEFDVDEFGLSNGTVKLKKYNQEDDLNFQFIIDAFKTDTPTSETPDFVVNIDEVNLTEMKFSFKDENKSKQDFGVNFSDLDLEQINLAATDVTILPREYTGKIALLNFKEKSGFDLSSLTAIGGFGEKGLKLSDTRIKTTNSDIDLPQFALEINQMSDFQDFVDSVLLVGDLSTSKVSMYDVSLFAPQLEGMHEVVKVRGKTNNTVSALNIQDLVLNIGSQTEIAGDFYLPDFTDLDSTKFDQLIASYNVSVKDIESVRLPFSASQDYIEIDNSVKGLDYVRGTNLSVKGTLHNLTINPHHFYTGIGNLDFTESLLVKSDSSFSSIKITPLGNGKRPISIDRFDVSKLTSSSEVGRISGKVGLKEFTLKNKKLKAKTVNGIFRNTEILGYSYKYIFVDNVDYSLDQSFTNSLNSLDGVVYVRDENLDMTFNGAASIGNETQINALINLECAHLAMIHPSLKDRGEMYTKIKVFGTGSSLKRFNGQIDIDTLYYSENNKNFSLDHLSAILTRNSNEDIVDIKSSVLDAYLNGKIDVKLFKENIMYQVANIVPAFFPNKREVTDLESQFDYNINVKQINPILEIFYPELKIADSTTINGLYDGETNNFNLNAKSDYVEYKYLRVNNIYTYQDVSSDQLYALLQVDQVLLNDSLTFKEIQFTGIANEGLMDSQLVFHDIKGSRSNLEWYTYLRNRYGFEIELHPSYLTINDHRWNLNQDALLSYSDQCFVIDQFKLEREKQYVSINGMLSEYPQDHLNIDVMNLDLEDLSLFLRQETQMSGEANIVGYISNPYENFKFSGESIIEGLFVNETEVGDISFAADYDSGEDKIKMFGDIFYKRERTFQFKGDYFVQNKREDSLDFSMTFKNTDISVVNEFLDPEVVTDLQGKLNGAFKLGGSVKKPELTGGIDFNDGKANLAVLGADYYFSGEVQSVVDGIYINTMPISDKFGNTGYVNGSLFHDNFSNFLFELVFNLTDHPFERDPKDRSKPKKIDRFMVMETKYSEDSPYYGDAFVTGNANISGHADNLSITADVKTKKGTKINFPMYGPTQVEQAGFVTFKKPEGEEIEVGDKIDFTGVDLSLNFDITPDAEVKLIFDEDIGDEIAARGEGDILMNVDKYGDLAINGTYTVTDGFYDFMLASGAYKQKFIIKPGGTVQWSGDPYEAYLDIETYYKTTANLSVVMPDVLENKSSENEEIYSYLYLQGDMMNPQITFDLKAPKATEAGKAVISRIRSDQDELNKQFFALLVTKGFLPLSGQQGQDGGSGSALLDLASTQINSVLGKVSENYQLNVNLENDNLSGQFAGEFGVSKGFLGDRLVVSGSLGLGGVREDNTQTQTATGGQNSTLVDLEVEYLLNKKGTFRVSAFNESNNNAIIQNNNRGQYTQGAGISYKEDFHNLGDFKLAQFFANLFRKKENRVDIREDEDKRVPIPDKYLKDDENAIKEEE